MYAGTNIVGGAHVVREAVEGVQCLFYAFAGASILKI